MYYAIKHGDFPASHVSLLEGTHGLRSPYDDFASLKNIPKLTFKEGHEWKGTPLQLQELRGLYSNPWAKWTTEPSQLGAPPMQRPATSHPPPGGRPETMASYWGKWDSPWWPRNEKKHLSCWKKKPWHLLDLYFPLREFIAGFIQWFIGEQKGLFRVHRGIILGCLPPLNPGWFAPENRPKPKRKLYSIPTIHFQVAFVSFREGMLVGWYGSL